MEKIKNITNVLTDMFGVNIVRVDEDPVTKEKRLDLTLLSDYDLNDIISDFKILADKFCAELQAYLQKQKNRTRFLGFRVGNNSNNLKILAFLLGKDVIFGEAVHPEVRGYADCVLHLQDIFTVFKCKPTELGTDVMLPAIQGLVQADILNKPETWKDIIKTFAAVGKKENSEVKKQIDAINTYLNGRKTSKTLLEAVGIQKQANEAKIFEGFLTAYKAKINACYDKYVEMTKEASESKESSESKQRILQLEFAILLDEFLLYTKALKGLLKNLKGLVPARHHLFFHSELHVCLARYLQAIKEKKNKLDIAEKWGLSISLTYNHQLIRSNTTAQVLEQERDDWKKKYDKAENAMFLMGQQRESEVLAVTNREKELVTKKKETEKQRSGEVDAVQLVIKENKKAKQEAEEAKKKYDSFLKEKATELKIIEQLKKKIEKLEQEVEQQNNLLKDKELQIGKQNNDKVELIRQKVTLDNQLLQTKHELGQVSAALKEAQTKWMQLQAECEEAKKRLEPATSAAEELKQQNKILQEENKQLWKIINKMKEFFTASLKPFTLLMSRALSTLVFLFGKFETENTQAVSNISFEAILNALNPDVRGAPKNILFNADISSEHVSSLGKQAGMQVEQAFGGFSRYLEEKRILLNPQAATVEEITKVVLPPEENIQTNAKKETSVKLKDSVATSTDIIMEQLKTFEVKVEDLAQQKQPLVTPKVPSVLNFDKTTKQAEEIIQQSSKYLTSNKRDSKATNQDLVNGKGGNSISKGKESPFLASDNKKTDQSSGFSSFFNQISNGLPSVHVTVVTPRKSIDSDNNALGNSPKG